MAESCVQHSGVFPLPHGVSAFSEGKSGNSDISHVLITSVIAQEDSVNKMWSEYMKEAGEYDKLMINGWKDGAIGLLVFVSTDPLIPMPLS